MPTVVTNAPETGARYRVTAINHWYDGLVFDCKFEKGVWEGPLNQWQLTMFREWGYKCTVIANS